jgi:RNA polymerase sigma factor (sigma-70 family)
MKAVPETPGDDDSGRTGFLARAVQQGDHERFDELYARTAPALYAWAVLRAPASVDAGDILGEVWLRAVERLRTHDGENYEFRAWIFGIAKNVLLQVLRTRGNDRTRLNSGCGANGLSTNALEHIPESVTSISQRLAREDTVRRFLEYAQLLDTDDRDLLVHCGVEGNTCTEAARRLGLGDEVAAKRWQRLRVELRSRAWVRELLLVVE